MDLRLDSTSRIRFNCTTLPHTPPEGTQTFRSRPLLHAPSHRNLYFGNIETKPQQSETRVGVLGSANFVIAERGKLLKSPLAGVDAHEGAECESSPLKGVGTLHNSAFLGQTAKKVNHCPPAKMTLSFHGAPPICIFVSSIDSNMIPCKQP